MRSRHVLPLLCSVACHDPATLDTKVPVDGLSLHLVCNGEGSPTVVFESGLGNDARAWSKVQPEVAKLTRACAYDRAGLGASSPAPPPHSNRDMVAELHAKRAQQKFVARQKAQAELAAMSSNSVVVTLRDSSHHIPLESPAEVVKAVNAVVKAARDHSRLSEAL